jgi:hypothetical protein
MKIKAGNWRGAVAWQNRADAVTTSRVPATRRSSFLTSGDSDFFSDCLLLSISLHNAHGCLPSKVLTNASFKGASWEYVTTIPTHATDWRKAQCSPMDEATAKANASFASRRSTSYTSSALHSVNPPPWLLVTRTLVGHHSR